MYFGSVSISGQSVEGRCITAEGCERKLLTQGSWEAEKAREDGNRDKM